MAGKKGGTSVASATEEKRETGIRARIDRVFDDEKGKLKAVASANIGDFAVHGIRLYQDDKGEFFISMPSNSYKNAKGETQYGILVNSEGSAYARYSGIMPHARQVVEAHLNKLADYCVEEGISNTEDGKWTITYDELYEHFGTVVTPSNGWGEMLLAKLKLQDEVDAVIATEDEFEMDYHLEYCEQCQEGGIEGAMSLMSLMGCNLLDVHLQNDDGKGSKQFIPELEPSTLSEDGKREFADVLQAKIILMKDDTITVQGVPMERIKRFSDVLCQNCTMEDYHKFIAPKSGEVRTEYATVRHTWTYAEVQIDTAAN